MSTRTSYTARRAGQVAAAALLTAGHLALTACDPGATEPTSEPEPEQQPERGIVLEDQSILFDGFVHDSNLPMPMAGEGMSGAAWLDYDADGDLDAYLPNGKAGAAALFRNGGDGTFTDVAAEAGVANDVGSSGVVVGDIDNNGYPDIFLTGEGHFAFAEASPTVLYLNNGDGTFRDISDIAGVPGAKSSLAAAMGDIDNDGYLDIFIASPGHLDVAPFMGLPAGTFGGLAEQHANTLYRNTGPDQDGAVIFEDISATAGIDDAMGACVVTFSDYDDDGWLDIFVGNCNEVGYEPVPWHLYRNNGPDADNNITFTDIASEVGLASGDGRGYWMATAIADYDNDGDLDLFSTNYGAVRGAEDPFYDHRRHALFRRDADGTFTNVAAEHDLADGPFAWGATFADLDNDGFQDLYFAGSMPILDAFGPGRGTPGRLFFNDGEGSLTEAPEEVTGSDLSLRYTSGVARGDYDGDGFLDILVMAETVMDRMGEQVIDEGTPVLLRNQGNGNRYLRVRLIGTDSNAMGIGARVYVSSGDLEQVREVQAGSSFASSESPWPSFGMGKHDEAQVTVRWPSGLHETFGTHATQQLVTLTEGQGTPVE